MKARQISAGLALALFVGGCGGSTQTTNTPESIDTTAAATSTVPLVEEPTTSRSPTPKCRGAATAMCALC